MLLVNGAGEYLDAYHSIDSSVEILLRSLHDNPPQASDDDDDDDYEDEDYYDDYDEDDVTDEDDTNDDDSYNFEDYVDSEDDISEEEEDESILDPDVDRKVELKDMNLETTNDEQSTSFSLCTNLMLELNWEAYVLICLSVCLRVEHRSLFSPLGKLADRAKYFTFRNFFF